MVVFFVFFIEMIVPGFRMIIFVVFFKEKRCLIQEVEG